MEEGEDAGRENFRGEYIGVDHSGPELRVSSILTHQ